MRSGRLVSGNGERAFGGSALSLLLRASSEHAPPAGRCHSLHAHFLQPVRVDGDVEVDLRVLRASRTFTTVAGELSQDGRPVVVATTSFHLPRRSRQHAVRAPLVPGDPWDAPAAPAVGGPIPSESALSRAPVDLREAAGRHGHDGRPVLRYWVRFRTPPATPVDHAAALAWVSDLCLTRVVDLEHEGAPGVRQAASLDHALWFHRSPDLGAWLLYELTSPSYVDELALSTGRFFDRTGRLVASVAQESLLRRRQG